MTKTTFSILLFALIQGGMPLAHVYAQTAKPIIEKVPTFLEYQLEMREPTLNVAWNWSKVEGQPHTYEIIISSPTSWETAHLCVDDQLAKAIPQSASRFVWSFKSLPIGKHMVSLLITDEKGNIGVVHRPIRIR